MSDTVPVRLMVGSRTLAAGMTRQGEWWTLSAAAFPEHKVSGRDVVRLKALLAKKLLPLCEQVERSRGAYKR